MPKLIIFSHDADDYLKVIQRADLPNLEIVTAPADEQLVTLCAESNSALY
ncbi:MAG: hypothetical protein L0287_22745 [Anaerolineae bacterium]|nr:hypothetical protein [Anaerolineae bacterium]MCI0611126.1 hypothetical protein [Anaerolineae bacterium]